jgi:hypothetical protein
MPKKTFLIPLAMFAGVLAAASLAYAAVTVSFSAKASPSRAGKPTGLYVNVKSTDPAAAQPPIMTRLVIKLQRGGKFNARQFKRCKLATLRARGPKGCSRRSRIGTGNGIGMARPVVEDPVNGKLTLFNGDRQGGRDTVLVHVFPDLGPTFVTVCKVHRARTIDCTIPPIKTLPSAPDASVVSIKTRTPVKRVTKKRGKRKKKYYLMVAPHKCKGKWKGSGTFYFATGEKRVVKMSQRCKRAKRR